MVSDYKNLQVVLERKDEILFAYLYGSVLTASEPHDLDLGVYLKAEAFEQLRRCGDLSLGFLIPLEMELEGMLRVPVDIQILNGAPLSFRHRVFCTGKLLVDRNQDFREGLVSITAVEYFDFRLRREEYLAEVIS
jgi:hypothetical protein